MVVPQTLPLLEIVHSVQVVATVTHLELQAQQVLAQLAISVHLGLTLQHPLEPLEMLESVPPDLTVHLLQSTHNPARLVTIATLLVSQPTLSVHCVTMVNTALVPV